ncbi:SacI homology domain-containing protein [Mycena floridula]|nr:SacI homology domain-containing protein [Mycena floridula]
MKPVHERLQLYTEGTDSYVFVPVGDATSRPSLTVYRSTGDIVLNEPGSTLSSSARRTGKPILGILGLISLSLSEYLVVMTGRELRGRLMGHDVYRATEFDILPLNPNVSTYNPPHPVEAHLLSLLRSHLYGGVFLFSYGYDLTRRLQAQWADSDTTRGLWEVADDRFFWNRFLQTRFIDASVKQDLSAYILPIMYGTFDIRLAFLHGRHMQLCLISRRSRFRAGTRYFRRGIDEDGHVANFNETEQLLLVEPQRTGGILSGDNYAAKLSFVQIRGSVPLFWAEVNTLRYKPDLQIMDLQTTPDAMKAHLNEQVSIYGEQTLVNLVNQKGYEKPVKEAYERYISEINLSKVQYEYFDFHNECKNMRWDRISVLVDRIQNDLKKHSYFHAASDQAEPIATQQGTVRTNCMDNLDRTNVVQATLAKWTLNKQLKALGILPDDRSIDDYETVSRDFREMWADHADSIAKAYGGSGALKSDFTRTSKRTKKGLMDDGVKSVLRYLKNNYFDGARQDAFDLVTGNWLPRRNPANAMFLVTDARPLVTRSIPLVASFSVFMILAGLTLPRTSDYSLSYYFLLWITLLTASLAFMMVNGVDYVAWPRLLPPTDIIYYNGPGHRSGHHGKGWSGSRKLIDASAKWMTRGRGRHLEGEIPLTATKKRFE